MYLHEDKEMALASYSFPTERRFIDSHVRSYLQIDNNNLIDEFNLGLFEMNLQSINRTFIDKVFALCDYYMQGKSIRYSRHLYDICKLKSEIVFDDDFKSLVNEVRKHRAAMKICPSALPDINIPKLIHEFCDNNFYKQDYYNITDYFINDKIEYDDAVLALIDLADSGYF